MAPVWPSTDLVRTPAILWMLASVYSLTALVPINNRIASWEESTPPADWKTYRSRWDLLHRWPHDSFRVSDCGSR
jgi:hypothetical protein